MTENRLALFVIMLDRANRARRYQRRIFSRSIRLL